MTNREKNLLFILSGSLILLVFSRTKTGANLMSKVIDSTVELIKNFEDFSPVPYVDANGHSIGYGHFIKPGENFTSSISEEQASVILANDSQHAANIIGKYVTVELTDNQKSALISFVYNIGEGNFKTSTALARLNTMDYQGAADAMLWFNKSRDQAGNLQVNNVLVDRRAAERELFLTA